MKVMNSLIKSLKLANHLILLSCSPQRNHSTKLGLQVNCQVSIPAARSQRAQKSKRKVRTKGIKVYISCKDNQKRPKGQPVSRKREEMLACKSGLKWTNPVEIFWNFTDNHLNFSSIVTLGYLRKIYINPTFSRYTLHNLQGQVLQTHFLALVSN